MNLSEIWDNLMGYFQNTDVQRQGNGVITSNGKPMKIMKGWVDDYVSEKQAPQVLGSQDNYSPITFKDETKPPYPEELQGYTRKAADQYKLDPLMLASLVAQETGGFGYQPIRGSSGERGITQIIPSIWASNAGYTDRADEYGNMLETNPEFALMEAARILSMLEEQYPGYGLAVYNAGPNYDPGIPYQQEILGRIGR